MEKSETSGSRIYKLRESMQETQEQFANHLGVKRAAVSAWEKDDRLRRPSAAMYLKLASLARSPEDARWFLGQAAIEDRVVLSLADTLRAGTVVAPTQGQVVRVEHLPGTRDVGSIFAQIPAGMSPDDIRYMMIEKDYSQFLFKKGEIAIFDVSDSTALGFCNLWDSIIMAKLPPQYWQTAEGLRLGPPSHFLGVLRLVSASPLSVRWAARLDPMEADKLESGVDIGYWRPDADLDSFGELNPEIEARLRVDESYRAHLEKKWGETASKEMRPHESVEIIGRVVAWSSLLTRRKRKAR